MAPKRIDLHAPGTACVTKSTRDISLDVQNIITESEENNNKGCETIKLLFRRKGTLTASLTFEPDPASPLLVGFFRFTIKDPPA